MSPGAAGRMAKASSLGLERVLPGADFREHLDGRLQVPTRVALGGRDHSRLGAAQERIGRELLGKRGGKRRLAAIALRLLARLALLQARVRGLDRLGEADVGERVFVTAVDARGLREARELAEGVDHLRRGALEKAPAAAGEERVAAEDQALPGEGDVARGGHRDVEYA